VTLLTKETQTQMHKQWTNCRTRSNKVQQFAYVLGAKEKRSYSIKQSYNGGYNSHTTRVTKPFIYSRWQRESNKVNQSNSGSQQKPTRTPIRSKFRRRPGLRRPALLYAPD